MNRFSACVDLYWLPLGAGDNTHCVRTNGRIFEAVSARLEHRDRCDLYHSALEVRLGSERWVVEMAPVWSGDEPDHGAVAEGPVGLAWLGRWRLFRYEVRRWAGGVIPDAAEAVASPVRLSHDRDLALRVLALAPQFPTAVWGRDELRAGDMWNSNSLISWLLACSGHDIDELSPPDNGRAPGWAAGLVMAERQRSRGAVRRPDGGAGDQSTSRAVRSSHVSRRTTSLAVPSRTNTTGIRRLPL